VSVQVLQAEVVCYAPGVPVGSGTKGLKILPKDRILDMNPFAAAHWLADKTTEYIHD